MADEVLANGRQQRKLPQRLLDVVFAEVGEAGLDRAGERLAGLTLADADQRHAAGMAAAASDFIIDRVAQAAVTFRNCRQRRAAGAGDAGRASVRGPGRVAQ